MFKTRITNGVYSDTISGNCCDCNRPWHTSSLLKWYDSCNTSQANDLHGHEFNHQNNIYNSTHTSRLGKQANLMSGRGHNSYFWVNQYLPDAQKPAPPVWTWKHHSFSPRRKWSHNSNKIIWTNEMHQIHSIQFNVLKFSRHQFYWKNQKMKEAMTHPYNRLQQSDQVERRWWFQPYAYTDWCRW